MGGELGDVPVIRGAALGLDDGEEPIADVVHDDVGEPAAEVELVRDVVGGSGVRGARLVGGGLGEERSDDLVERGDELFGERRASDDVEQRNGTDGSGEVRCPCALGAVAVSHG